MLTKTIEFFTGRHYNMPQMLVVNYPIIDEDNENELWAIHKVSFVDRARSIDGYIEFIGADICWNTKQEFVRAIIEKYDRGDYMVI